MLDLGLESLITFNPWTLNTATPLAEAARLFEETGQCDWPVVDPEGRLIGVLTESELGEALSAGSGNVETIGKFIRRSPSFADQDTDPLEALERMLAQRVRMLPVVDHGRVVGTLATTDYLRELSYGQSRAAQELALDHMERTLEALDGDLTMGEAQAALAALNATCLPVEQGDFPLGVVSRRSLQRHHVRRLARQLVGVREPEPTLAQLLQSFPTFQPGGTLAEAATLMVEHQLDALAVTNQAAHLLGYITENRLLNAMLDR